jgi:hypothetical protein
MPFKNWLTPIVLVLSTSQARALDPFTIAAGAKAASGLLDGNSDLESGAETALAIGDLLVETDIDPGADKDAESAVRKLENLNRMVGEAKYSKQELEELLRPDDLHAKSHAGKIRHLIRLIRTMKRIGALMGIRPKVAERINQVQQTQVSYMMLEELTAMRQAQFKKHLEERESEVGRKVMLEKIREEEEHNRSNLTSSFKGRERR